MKDQPAGKGDGDEIPCFGPGSLDRPLNHSRNGLRTELVLAHIGVDLPVS